MFNLSQEFQKFSSLSPTSKASISVNDKIKTKALIEKTAELGNQKVISQKHQNNHPSQTSSKEVDLDKKGEGRNISKKAAKMFWLQEFFHLVLTENTDFDPCEAVCNKTLLSHDMLKNQDKLYDFYSSSPDLALKDPKFVTTMLFTTLLSDFLPMKFVGGIINFARSTKQYLSSWGYFKEWKNHISDLKNKYGSLSEYGKQKGQVIDDFKGLIKSCQSKDISKVEAKKVCSELMDNF